MRGGRVEGIGTDFWLGGPTRRLPERADVPSKNPDSLPLDLASLLEGLVQTVRGGPATCLVSGLSNPDTDMPNSPYHLTLIC